MVNDKNNLNLINKLETFKSTLQNAEEIEFVNQYITIVKYYNKDPKILNKIKQLMG